MTVSFYSRDASGHDLWRPTNDVSCTFMSIADAMSEILGVDSGISEAAEGVHEIDIRVFHRFTAALVERYCETDQGILRTLTAGFIATCLVLINRAGYSAPEVTDPEQQQAWLTLRDQHAQAMPV